MKHEGLGDIGTAAPVMDADLTAVKVVKATNGICRNAYDIAQDVGCSAPVMA